MIAGEISRGATPLNAEFLREAYSFVAARAGRLRQILRIHRRSGVEMRFDRVDSVAIGADRRHPVSVPYRLAVDAVFELLGDVLVALTAGGRNVEFKDRRFGISGIENFVRAVAIGANRGFFRTGGDRVAMHALLVGSDHLRTLAFHDEFLAVTGSAGVGNIGVMDSRLRVACREEFMRAAVTVDTGSCVGVSALYRLCVKAAIIGSLLVGVAGSAGNFLRSGLMRRALDVGMTIDASEHAAVNGIFERLGIDVKADGLAVFVVSEAGIAVASEALICGRFLRLFCGGGGNGGSS